MAEHKSCYSKTHSSPELDELYYICMIEQDALERRVVMGGMFQQYCEELLLGKHDRMNFESLCKHTLGIPGRHMNEVYECMQAYRDNCLKKDA